MLHARAALQNALNEVFSSTSVEQRKHAAAQLVESLSEYLTSDEPPTNPPAVEGATERTRKVLGAARAPVSDLSDDALDELNRLLPWAAMTVDQNGRIIGRPWTSTKRMDVHTFPESRLISFADAFPLEGRHVLEFGCFEGIHTVGLMTLGARVTAVDGRLENVLKTLARVWAYGYSCDVRLWNFEQAPAPSAMPESFDVLHHIGVLYHLSNPVEHLDEVLPRAREAVLLDTHICADGEANQSYEVGGRTFHYRHKGEPHASIAPFAGLADHAKYLVLDEIAGHLRHHGFPNVQVASDRPERNGRRVTIWAFRQ
jgi:tRNA (mo5U34)-methyltransferase